MPELQRAVANARVGNLLYREMAALFRRRKPLVLTLLVVASVFATYVLFFPRRTFFASYTLGIPEPFSRPPLLDRFAMPLLFVTTAGALTFGFKVLPSLLERPRRLTIAVFLLGVMLNFAMIISLRDGVDAYYRRALLSGHGEFLIEAVTIDDLNHVVRNYEEYVRGHRERIFLANKGPGVIVFFGGLTRIANAPFTRPLLAAVRPPADIVVSTLAERGVVMTARQVEDLRYLLACVLIIFPLLTYTPIFLLYWLGEAYGGAKLGTLAALLYPFVPAITLQVAHLDFALFPLFTTAVMAFFAYGVQQSKLRYIMFSAAVASLYFSMTLGAASLVAALLALLSFAAISRLRAGDHVRRITIDAARVTGLFVLVLGAILLTCYLAFHFEPVSRYTYARSLQSNWTTSEYDLFWVNSNLLGYFLSLGLIYAACVFAQQVRSSRSVFAGTDDAIDHLTLSWLCLLVALTAFGRQHGETNRLWAFLNPLACLITARLLYDSIDWRRLSWPVFIALFALVIARYRLNYF